MSLTPLNLQVKTGWGFAFKSNLDSHNFSILDFGFHYHPHLESNSVVQEQDLCPFRAGVYIAVCNLEIAFGKFWQMRRAPENDQQE